MNGYCDRDKTQDRDDERRCTDSISRSGQHDQTHGGAQWHP